MQTRELRDVEMSERVQLMAMSGDSSIGQLVQAVSDACLRSCCYDTVLARQILQGVISADSLLTIAEFQSLQFLQALEPCARRKSCHGELAATVLLTYVLK